MNKEAITRHDIYRKLAGFSEQDLQVIDRFIDAICQKQSENKKTLRLENILKNHHIDLVELDRFKKETWRHVEEDFRNE